METETLNETGTANKDKTDVSSSGGETGQGSFKEDGKSWYQYIECGSIFREHDEKFQGMRFEHKRCPFCNRITSIHPLHWLNHMDKCADKKYSWDDLLKLQHCKPSELKYARLGRK